MLTVDYSNLELRILENIARDRNRASMIRDLFSKQDVNSAIIGASTKPTDGVGVPIMSTLKGRPVGNFMFFMDTHKTPSYITNAFANANAAFKTHIFRKIDYVK